MEPSPTRHRHTGRTAAITIAAVSVLAIAAVAAAWQFGWLLGDRPTAAQPTASSLPVATQVECSGVRREFSAWNRDMPRLSTMITASNPRDVVRHELEGLKEDGDALLKAVSGYPDQPSKQLAVAVADYNVDLSFMALEWQLSGGTINEDKKQKAVQSAGAVQTAYKTFMQTTCGEKN